VTSAPVSHSFQATPDAAGFDVRPFGRAAGQDVSLFSFTNAHGLRISVTNYGATVTSLSVPDRKGNLGDVVAGHDDVSGYVDKRTFFGATVGRVANRIRGASFTLDGTAYAVAANEGNDQLHGGPDAFDRRVWRATPGRVAGGRALHLELTSPEGDQGFPGTVTASVVYALLEDDTFLIEMSAVSDRPTPLNMAHHGYWNLGGHASGPVLGHELAIAAHAYTPGNPQIPDGRIVPVAGTPFDFVAPKAIGRDLEKVGTPAGYDHNFVVDGEPTAMRFVARLSDPSSGRVMTLSANQPGVQFYSGIYLGGSPGKGGVTYERYGALCLETQTFPNAVNVPAWAPTAILRPGRTYHHVMRHAFSIAP